MFVSLCRLKFLIDRGTCVSGCGVSLQRLGQLKNGERRRYRFHHKYIARFAVHCESCRLTRLWFVLMANCEHAKPDDMNIEQLIIIISGESCLVWPQFLCVRLSHLSAADAAAAAAAAATMCAKWVVFAHSPLKWFVNGQNLRFNKYLSSLIYISHTRITHRGGIRGHTLCVVAWIHVGCVNLSKREERENNLAFSNNVAEHFFHFIAQRIDRKTCGRYLIKIPSGQLRSPTRPTRPIPKSTRYKVYVEHLRMGSSYGWSLSGNEAKLIFNSTSWQRPILNSEIGFFIELILLGVWSQVSLLEVSKSKILSRNYPCNGAMICTEAISKQFSKQRIAHSFWPVCPARLPSLDFGAPCPKSFVSHQFKPFATSDTISYLRSWETGATKPEWAGAR